MEALISKNTTAIISAIYLERCAEKIWKKRGEMKDIPKNVFNFCLHKRIQQAKIKHAKKYLFFTRLDWAELGVVDVLIEVFKIWSKIWWLQYDEKTIEKMKFYGVTEEDKILVAVMRSLEDVNVQSDLADGKTNKSVNTSVLYSHLENSSSRCR